MTNQTDVAVQAANCIVEKNHWGYDTYVNVCTGGSGNVAWTPLDYVGGVLAVLVLTALALCILGVIVVAVRATR